MRTAVVVGAGIGGVTAAVALQQQGWRVTVLERARELGEVGAGLSIWPSAAKVLHGLGVGGVEPGPRPPGPLGLRLADGRWIMRADRLDAPTPVMIHRAQLHHRITARFGPDVTIRTAFTVTGVELHPDGATVLGAGEQVRADLVVAADGIRSTIRATLHPRYPGPRYAGYTSWRGLAEPETDDGGGETWGRGRRFGFARLVDGRTYWYATANQPAGRTGGLAEVRALFGDWHDPIPAILAATTLLQTDLYDLSLPLVPFVSGRVVLLGDAAHAMTPNLGRGACSAIEDAGALARHLGEQRTLDAALDAYDRERRRATTRLVAASRGVGVLGQVEHPATGAVRDGVLIAAGRLLTLRRPPRTAPEARPEEVVVDAAHPESVDAAAWSPELPEAAGFDHQVIETPGLRTHLATLGEGEPVLMLHGFPQHWWQWHAIAPLIAAGGYRVLCPDLRGAGWTVADDPRVEPESRLRDVLALLDALGIDRVHLVSHDMGAITAMHLAYRHPERVRTAVQVSVPPGFLRFSPRLMPAFLHMPRLAFHRPGTALRRLFTPRYVFRPMTQATVEAHLAPLRRADIDGAVRPLLRGLVLPEALRLATGAYRRQRLTVPTRFVFGRQDGPFPEALVARLCRDPERFADRVDFAYVDDAAHFLTDDAPDAVAALALDWFRRAG